MRSVFAIDLSQNSEIRSRPWNRTPSGSNIEGPTGSWTMASAAKLSSHACLSRTSTASRERRPATTAGWFSRSMPR